MLNTEIKYKLSTDYTRLEHLLRKGEKVIGFVPLVLMSGAVSSEYSKLTIFCYQPQYELFEIGASFFEDDLDKISFGKYCERENVRFIDFE